MKERWHGCVGINLRQSEGGVKGRFNTSKGALFTSKLSFAMRDRIWSFPLVFVSCTAFHILTDPSTPYLGVFKTSLATIPFSQRGYHCKGMYSVFLKIIRQRASNET